MQNFTIDRRDNLSYQSFVENYLRPCKPVIITDSLKHWSATEKWNLNYFRENFGKLNIHLDNQPMTLADFIDEVEASSEENPSRYLSGLVIPIDLPELVQDILPELKYTLPDRMRSRLLPFYNEPTPHGIPELLITGLGGRFKLHYDKYHLLGFVTQVYGDKEFTVFDPGQGQYLYPESNPDRENFSSLLNTDNVDLEKFPLFKHARPYKFILHAGETLFNPQGWWHTTRALQPSIAMVISTVNAINWTEFKNDYCRINNKKNSYAYYRNQLYYTIVGGLFSIKDKFISPD